MRYKSDICFKKDGNPRTTYEYEEEAWNGANYANEHYNQNLEPYQCQSCGGIHLSPVNRMTRSSTCNSCTDANGNYKQLYYTEEEAQQRARIINEEKNIRLDVYKCDYNDGWHLTKNSNPY